MNTDRPAVSPRLIIFFYLLSGVAGLIYEVVWVRLFHLIFGVTHQAAALVLAVYMGSMALGGWWGGKRVPFFSLSPLRLYAVTEILIGLYTIAVPFLFRWMEGLYPLVYRLSGHSSALTALSQILGPAFLIGLPSFGMGVTFPVLVTQLTGQESDRASYHRIVGYLFSGNLLGAAAGCLLAGFFLVPSLGLTGTNYLAVAFSLGTGVLAWFLSGPQESAGFSLEVDQYIDNRWFRRWFGIVLLLVGTFSFGLQILFTRLLSLIVNNTCYAFSSVLGVFLGGLFLGGAVGARLEFRYQRLAWGLIWGAVGLYSLLVIPLGKPVARAYLDAYFLLIAKSAAVPWGLLFLVAAAVLLVPAFLVGLSYPLGFSLYYSGRSVSSSTGAAYAFNTAGAVGGTLAVGFWLLPRLGTQGTLLVVVLGCLLVGVVMAVSEERLSGREKTAWAAGLVFLFVLASPAAHYDLTFKELVSEKTLFSREDASGLVEVFQRDQGVKVLISNRQQQEGDTSFFSLVSQRRQGYLPLLLHPHPESALLIGLGTGISHAAYVIYPLKEITCVELSPAVVEASRFFPPYNRNFIHREQVSLKIEDGRNFLMVTDRNFDLIVGDLFSPYRPGVGNLYSVEHFQNCRKHLNPGGIMCQWLPPHQLSPSALKSIIKSFASAFPEGSLWLTRQSLALIGGGRKITVDYAKLKTRMRLSAVSRDLADYRLFSPEEFLSLYIGEIKGFSRYLENAPFNTDDRPFVEFETPRYLHLLEGGELYYRNLVELLPLMVPFEGFSPVNQAALTSVRNAFQARRLASRKRLSRWRERR